MMFSNNFEKVSVGLILVLLTICVILILSSSTSVKTINYEDVDCHLKRDKYSVRANSIKIDNLTVHISKVKIHTHSNVLTLFLKYDEPKYLSFKAGDRVKIITNSNNEIFLYLNTDTKTKLSKLSSFATLTITLDDFQMKLLSEELISVIDIDNTYIIHYILDESQSKRFRHSVRCVRNYEL